MPTTYEIPFTRFTLPNGRQTPDSMVTDAETFALWEKVRDAGLRMTVEILRSGAISLCIEDPKLGDFDCAVVTNGPGVPAAVQHMLSRFTPERLTAWRAEMTLEIEEDR